VRTTCTLDHSHPAVARIIRIDRQGGIGFLHFGQVVRPQLAELRNIFSLSGIRDS
jgi:hypothetical protein